ncbi:MAG: tRNA lysidine(34) synthetase TilS [Leucobacter sp.]
MNHPTYMLTRLSVRRALQTVDPGKSDSGQGGGPLALVGLSGGADSLALASALAAEAGSGHLRGGAIVVDHGLQERSAEIAERAAGQARELGLDPVIVQRVGVDVTRTRTEGPESAARTARYAAFAEVAERTGAVAVLTAHTRDDQAEQVLLALTRGSGTRSIAGIPSSRELRPGTVLLRPFLAEVPEIRRATTEAACAERGLEFWSDPHNRDHTYTRVRVRETLIPVLEEVLGRGAQVGLARSADLAREDAAALDEWAAQMVLEHVEMNVEFAGDPGATALVRPEGVFVLTELPAAVRQRVIHRVAKQVFAVALSRTHTLAIADLLANWSGQGPIFVPGMRVTRNSGGLRFAAQHGSPRD